MFYCFCFCFLFFWGGGLFCLFLFGLYTYLRDSCPTVFSCNMDASECSERTGWEPVRGWPAKARLQQSEASLHLAGNGFQFFYIYLFIFVAAVVVVVPALEKSHESEISSIMSRAGRTGIASDSFRWPDVVFIYAGFFFLLPAPPSLSPHG